MTRWSSASSWPLPRRCALRVLREGRWVTTPFSGPVAGGCPEVSWDGAKRIGRPRDGAYSVIVDATDVVGSTAVTLPFLTDAHAPVVQLSPAARLASACPSPPLSRFVSTAPPGDHRPRGRSGGAEQDRAGADARRRCTRRRRQQERAAAPVALRRGPQARSVHSPGATVVPPAPPSRRRAPAGTQAPLRQAERPDSRARAKDGDSPHSRRCVSATTRVEARPALLRDPEDALDATQDTLASLSKLGQFRGEAAFTTWLHRLTINACRDLANGGHGATDRSALGRRAALPGRRPRLPRRSSPSCARSSGRRLARIPDDQARVLVLKDGLGLSFEEISEASGMPVGTAKCYAHRGRAGMRAHLEEATS